MYGFENLTINKLNNRTLLRHNIFVGIIKFRYKLSDYLQNAQLAKCAHGIVRPIRLRLAVFVSSFAKFRMNLYHTT